jgi:hypothetical protein
VNREARGDQLATAAAVSDHGCVFGLIVLGILVALILFAYLLDRNARKRGYRVRTGRQLGAELRNTKRAVRRGPFGVAKNDAQRIYEEERARRGGS